MTRFSTSGFVYVSVSPKPLSIRTIPNFFENSWEDIRSSRCTSSVFDTGGKWEKTSIRKVLNI